MYLDPMSLELIARDRQREILHDAERRRLIALARAGQTPGPAFQRTRHLTGALLIRIGEWLQGARRLDRPAPAALDAPAPAGLNG